MSDQANIPLMQGLHFTPMDLAANRQGVLTETQRERLDSLRKSGARSVAIIAGIVIVITAGVALLLYLSSASRNDESGSTLTLVAGVLGAIVVVYILLIIVGMARGRELSSQPVKALTGRVNVEFHPMRGYSETKVIAQAAGVNVDGYYTIKVGRTTIYTTDEGAANAFENGEEYRIYVIGRGNSSLIVSAERAGVGMQG